jgi:predicted metal-dependent peptidase
MSKLTAEQRVQKAHVWLMKHPKYCLYSGVLMIGKTEVKDEGCPTAYTDGRNTAYGRKFVDKLSESDLKGLILHENLHKAFRHTTVWKHLYKEQAQLANMACDYVINLMIVDADDGANEVTLPEGGLLDEKYRGMDAGTVYRMLKEDAESGGGGGEGGFDEHGWESAEGMSPEEKEQLARDVDQALRQGAILAGKMKGNVPREIGDVLTPKVDWREALREFITSFCVDKDESTWRRPSRRWIGDDVYMPSLIGESVGRVVVAIDMSGSIGSDEVSQFLGEVRDICDRVKPEGIDLLYWDTDVCQHEKYEQDQLDNLLGSTKPRGGGGTNPQCIVDYMSEKKIKAECAIVLTDGYVPNWGNGWSCPTLWGITTDEVSGVGKTVHMQ